MEKSIYSSVTIYKCVNMCNFVHDLHAIVAKTCNDTCPLQPVAETGLAAGTYWGWR